MSINPSELSHYTLDHLSIEEKRQLAIMLEEREKRKKQNKIVTYFPDTGPLRRGLYKKHLAYFKAGEKYRERGIVAANRIGKTEGCTCYEASLHMTGEYPVWWEGRRFDRGVRVWFAGTTAETTRDILQRKLLGPVDSFGTGLVPAKKLIGKPRMDSGIPDSVETFMVRHVSGDVSRGQFKAYKQGRKSFEGDEQDIIVLDEEPPLDIYSECLLRTMTTDGMIMVGFTPKEGLTETVLSFMPGGTVPNGGVNGSKFIINATWDDVPHLTEEAKKEILDSTPLHLRGAVSKGIPQLGSGAIYPIEEEAVVMEDFPIPDHWPRAKAQDVGWNWTACVWGAWNRETDVWYIYADYKRGQAEPVVHANAIKTLGDWIPTIMDPAANARGQRDGKKLKQEYEELMNQDIENAENSVEAGLLECYNRMASGRLKIFKSCVHTMEELRIYRRDKNGKVVKKMDHLMDCMRYLIMTGKEVASTKKAVSFKNLSVTQIMERIPLGVY